MADSGPPSASGPRLFVASGFDDRVYVLDSGTGAVLDTLALDPRPADTDEPHGLAFSPGGEWMFATVAHGQPTLWKYEVHPLRQVGRLDLPLRGAARIRMAPDGTRLYVTDYYRSGMGRPSGIAVVDPASLAVLDTLTVCAAPHDAAPDPSGRHLALACALSDEVVLLDAHTLEERWRTPVGPQPGPPGAPVYRPLNVTWHPDGETFYVGLHASGEIVRYDRTGSEKARARIGGGPAQLAWSSAGVVVARRADASLSVLDPESLEERRRISLGAHHPHGLIAGPHGPIAGPHGGPIAGPSGGTAPAERSDPPGGAAATGRALAYVSTEGRVGEHGTVLRVDLDTGAIDWQRSLGSFLVGVALEPRPRDE